MVLCNTSDEDLARNIKLNSARDLPWLQAAEEHDGVAVIVGGGPSAADCLDRIDYLQGAGATVFALNAASDWLRGHGIETDYQFIADAKDETATLVDPDAKAHLFASQVSVRTMDAASNPTVWHLAIDDVESYFPSDRVTRGGYVLLGGGHTGNAAMCAAYAMGFREIHVFGYDSSHRDGQSHAYRQAMNDFIPTVDVEWAGRTFTASVAMKAQAEQFQTTAKALQASGCALSVYGDGLLPHMWRAKPENLTERDKYRLMWQFDSYRECSPGEMTVEAFLESVKPDGLVIDFGCGTGRASVELAKRGHEVLLIDFADNCRDDEALPLPFLEWDLTQPMNVRAPYGFCSDVMEHIPPEDVNAVLANIMQAAERVFFRIDTDDDQCGVLIGHKLHMSVFPHEEWRRRLEAVGTVLADLQGPEVSVFYVERK